MVVVTFFTLFTTALFLFSRENVRRRNLNLLKNIETERKLKSESADVTLDITSGVNLK